MLQNKKEQTEPRWYVAQNVTYSAASPSLTKITFLFSKCQTDFYIDIWLLIINSLSRVSSSIYYFITFQIFDLRPNTQKTF